MNNPTIAFTKPCVAELIELEIREPNDDEALVKLDYSSVSSGTERANLVGEVNI